MSERFGERVRAALHARGPLCVGIDPHAALLAAWGLTADAQGVREFGLRTVEAAAGRVGFVKPQVSFFERFGSAGIATLEEVLAASRAAGLIVIADAKRGDIGSTMDDYARAWLTPGSPLEADALTVSPFLGVGALDGTFTLAEKYGKGVFVLAATSNPEAEGLQRSTGSTDATVSASVIAEVSARNAELSAAGEWGSFGFVIGATVDWTQAGIEPFAPAAPILAPGFGAQGATPADLRPRFGEMSAAVIASESRSILSAGPADLPEAISARASEYLEVAGV
ncbi:MULTISPECIES: orotidine-5'-phosphate decarboxylase [unclassified Microbacterium]|uniref:orotidine-5'-phosphate decarboxylase n=1 Tax=unclassified Microbacterium TaxID=2609290 RepID=UPI000CFAB7C3|nr:MULTISPECIES: orotidine-5'-phosphate decarboxylase [unclassified Microbacterium]PQZ61023.1 orotidine-5'-phosphate decarboxylase [Microbacterium sp. MYb43]PQZ82232.1 orotidine-5'-phosphate decarboxylase [Microbacterium sp. MYb40]PRB24066.1 orotidine-5'-phosphate decarboxylase [Microbacterium sp. MYb54]PRB30897.1 orotidine-5'-phosphate decarboxylase [Microbacterium sp. MYb50]PRB70680.1 orotidine-5'-phosphate decarboxylase [Microbacterium sp. MYb24]